MDFVVQQRYIYLSHNAHFIYCFFIKQLLIMQNIDYIVCTYIKYLICNPDFCIP
jgi:hypothetical protein